MCKERSTMLEYTKCAKYCYIGWLLHAAKPNVKVLLSCTKPCLRILLNAGWCDSFLKFVNASSFASTVRQAFGFLDTLYVPKNVSGGHVSSLLWEVFAVLFTPLWSSILIAYENLLFFFLFLNFSESLVKVVFKDFRVFWLEHCADVSKALLPFRTH